MKTQSQGKNGFFIASAQPLRVLHIEDDLADIRYIEMVLNDIPVFKVACEHVLTLSDAISALEKNEYDVVLLDLHLPDGVGLDLVKIVKQHIPDKPIVILSGAEDTFLTLDAVQCGAEEYLVKDQINSKVLMRAIRHAIDHKQKELKLAQLSQYDELTGLANRNLFSDRLRQALKRSRRNMTLIAVMFVDLDYFKSINDTFGHEAGDLLLKKVAERLSRCVRENDTVARLGGDEFAIILEGVQDKDNVCLVADKIINAMSRAFVIEGNENYITASIGISLQRGWEGVDVDFLLKSSDAAMYQVKAAGRNGYKFFEDHCKTEIPGPRKKISGSKLD